MCPDTSFSDLRSLAVKLNIASDKLNEIIDSAEHDLTSLNLGIEVYGAQVIDREYGDLDGLERLNDASYLGWCKLRGKWQLVLKIETEREIFNEGIHEVPLSGVDKTRYQPLKEASREIRAKAIEHFDDLKIAIEKEMNRIIAVVEQREKIRI